ncbi:MAG: hypothetical protein E6K56_07935 [Ignavibacteria bacterium]|nr:MAG: hypothetical protein E6K56_07935 [Ignavibacteria bacterium]
MSNETIVTVLRVILTFGIPLVLSLIATPLVIKLAGRVGAIDEPDERKIHTRPMPRLGGVGIYASLLPALVILYPINPFLHSISRLQTHQAILLIGSLMFMLAVGIWDDIRPIKAGRKFLAQALAATTVYVAGVHISSVTNILGSNLLDLGILDFPVTVLWIVGVTNAFNLIDGLDGLASGIAVIASITICAISCLSQHYAIAMISLALAGALIGFLKYNFNPARIFLGDSGSLFLGFSLALLSIQSSTKGSTAFAILVPLLALGLPIMDTLLSMIRRMLKSLVPTGSGPAGLLARLHTIVTPDKAHIHHRLIAKGLSQRTVVFVLYLVSCVFGGAAFALQVSNSSTNAFIVAAISIASVVGVRRLQYREIAVLRNGLLLPIYDSSLMHRTLFHAFLDLCYILIAFSFSFLLTTPGEMFSGREFFLSLAMVGFLQLSLFCAFGLYRETIRMFGLGDLLNILKTATAAVGITALFFMVTSRSSAALGVTGLILDFYILASLVAGTRASFHVLRYISRREIEGGRRTLIYGAGTDGMLLLQKILNDPAPKLIPVGFLDDDAELEGKNVNGYPVFGGHWKLEGLLHKMKVDELLIADQDVKPEILRRLEEIARLNSIGIRRSEIRLENMKTHEERTKAGGVLVYAKR